MYLSRARSYNWKCKKVKKNSFALLELEIADFGVFLEKNGLGPLGVNPEAL
jgi:hypothetical protein